MRGTGGEAEFLRTLGERLRRLRTEAGMTRHGLSQRCGVSERYIAQLEGGSGNVSVVLLRAIAQALGVSPGALLDEVLDAS